MHNGCWACCCCRPVFVPINPPDLQWLLSPFPLCKIIGSFRRDIREKTNRTTLLGKGPITFNFYLLSLVWWWSLATIIVLLNGTWLYSAECSKLLPGKRQLSVTNKGFCRFVASLGGISSPSFHQHKSLSLGTFFLYSIFIFIHLPRLHLRKLTAMSLFE